MSQRILAIDPLPSPNPTVSMICTVAFFTRVGRLYPRAPALLELCLQLFSFSDSYSVYRRAVFTLQREGDHLFLTSIAWYSPSTFFLSQYLFYVPSRVSNTIKCECNEFCIVFECIISLFYSSSLPYRPSPYPVYRLCHSHFVSTSCGCTFPLSFLVDCHHFVLFHLNTCFKASITALGERREEDKIKVLSKRREKKRETIFFQKVPHM